MCYLDSNYFCNPRAYKKQQNILLPSGIQQRDSIQIFFPHWLWTFSPLFTFVRLPSATAQTMFVNVHPKIEFENCITVSFTLITSKLIRRRKFLLWLGGFRIYERRVLNVRKANKSENNDARMKINKPQLSTHSCAKLIRQHRKHLVIFYAYFFYSQGTVCLEGQRKCNTLITVCNLSAAVYVKDAYIA